MVIKSISRTEVYRSLMIVGLLLGLFISSGEGVRLFPIPTNLFGNSSTHEPDAKNSASGRYNIGVRQARAFSAGKIKNSKRPLSEASAAISQENPGASTKFYLLYSHIDSSKFVKRSLDDFEHLPSGRAPPLS